jgi:hypothetical protein
VFGLKFIQGWVVLGAVRCVPTAEAMGNSLGTHFEITIGLKFIQGWVLLGAVILWVLCVAFPQLKQWVIHWERILRSRLS